MIAADGRGLQDVTINDKFAQFAEALFTADRHAREEVNMRAKMQQKLAEKEKLAKEEHLRDMAKKAREERAAATASRPRRESGSRRRSRSRSRSYSDSYSSRSDTDYDSEDERAHQRAVARKERREEGSLYLPPHAGTGGRNLGPRHAPVRPQASPTPEPRPNTP